MASTYTVSINKSDAGFGFTPFKYSLADCERKKKSANFKSLLVNTQHSKDGLPIQAVDATGAAHTAGLQAWDVITHINGQDIRTMAAKEIFPLIKNVPTGGSVQLTFVRSATPAPAPVLKPVGTFKSIFGFGKK